jgi:hypothetical protein
MVTYTAAVEPLNVLKTLFESGWQSYGGRVPKPYIYIWNETPSPRLDLSKKERVTIQYEPPGETSEYEGVPHAYRNVIEYVRLEIFTASNRQRLMDVSGELIRIIFVNQHNPGTTGFQTLRFRGFNESPESRRKNWKAEIRLTMENYGVPVPDFENIVGDP